MRPNSRGIVVSHEPLDQALEDLKGYVWENWNDFPILDDGLCITYEIPYREISGADATIPLNIYIVNQSRNTAGYSVERHEIITEVDIEDLASFAQYFNPNKEHPRWADLKQHLIEILVHELTHAMEFRAELSKRANIYDWRMVDRCIDDYGPECEEFYTRYFNTPIEVSAMTNEIVYQIIHNSGNTLPPRVEDALDLSIKWEEIEPYLTEKNKNLIRKRIYTRLYTGEVSL